MTFINKLKDAVDRTKQTIQKTQGMIEEREIQKEAQKLKRQTQKAEEEKRLAIDRRERIERAAFGKVLTDEERQANEELRRKADPFLKKDLDDEKFRKARHNLDRRFKGMMRR